MWKLKNEINFEHYCTSQDRLALLVALRPLPEAAVRLELILDVYVCTVCVYVYDYFLVFCIRWICLHVALWPLFHAAAWHSCEQ